MTCWNRDPSPSSAHTTNSAYRRPPRACSSWRSGVIQTDEGVDQAGSAGAGRLLRHPADAGPRRTDRGRRQRQPGDGRHHQSHPERPRRLSAARCARPAEPRDRHERSARRAATGSVPATNTPRLCLVRPGVTRRPPPAGAAGSSEAAAPLAFRCRSTVRNSFHGGGPRSHPRCGHPQRRHRLPPSFRSRGLGPQPSYAAGRSLSGPRPRAAAPLTPLSTARRPRRRESLVRTAPAVMPSLPAMSRQGIPAATARSSSHSARLTALWISARRNRASMRGSAWTSRSSRRYSRRKRARLRSTLEPVAIALSMPSSHSRESVTLPD